MTDNELCALLHAAEGRVLFHNGLWGACVGYQWAGPDGQEAGHVPPWESEALDRLRRKRMVDVQSDPGPFSAPVVATDTGKARLSLSH